MNPPTNIALVVLLIGAFTGCTEPAQPASPGDDESPEFFTLNVTRSGFYVYRTPVGATEPTSRMSIGDDPSFCFLMPRGTTVFAAEFWWAQGIDMYLQLAHSQPAEHSTNGNAPPLRLDLETPTPGQWYLYSGPGTAGGATDFVINMTFVTAQPREESDVTWTGEPCF